MATAYRIHPAIGIARVGNSDELFVGPERVGERPAPSGGFKDASCRVKRQAARFRIFAHKDDGTVSEITAAEAAITWTVHLANKKAAHTARGNSGTPADLTIDPGPRTVSGPNKSQAFDTGVIKFATGPSTTVPLGEIRSDSEGRLLILGGAGRSASPAGTPLSGYFWNTTEWYDDVSDGPVSASIKLKSNGSTPAVQGAWVVVAPPKFAPHLDSVITLYDRVLQTMIDAARLAAPTTTSYTQDVYPILQRARDTGWVENVFGSHTWPDPVPTGGLRQMIFNKLKAPGGGGGNMPDLNDSGTSDDRLTPTQYGHLQRWKDNAATYTEDWTGVPAPQSTVTPEGLDRAALEACVGGAFFPGIEAGGLPSARPIIKASNYSDAFRLDHAVVAPGDITLEMALPWQNDFYQCGDKWWPVPRPNDVNRGGAAGQSWTSGVIGSGTDMVDKWSELGFIVQQGAQYVEAERCDTPSIALLTPLLDFRDVPSGPMGMVREVPLAITFEVISPSGPITVEYVFGGSPIHPQLVAFNASATAGPTAANTSTMARLWVIYRTGTPGSSLPPQELTVRQQGTSRQWTVTVIGNTVPRKTAATAMALDRSGSMSGDRGDGQTKHDSLQQAAALFVDVMLEGDGVGIVAFNQSATVLQPVLQLGAGGLSDLNRGATKDIINGNGLDPSGATSIGNGIYEARGILNSTSTPYDTKALTVLTDGIENRWRYIADVAPQINEQTFAIGLGTPQNTSAAALQAVSGNHGGFLLITGAIGTDNRFLLQKYFLQILAGISNAEVVLDPDGALLPGRVERVPFSLIRGDAGVDVILLTPYPQVVDFRLETPSGQVIDPSVAAGDTGVRFVQGDQVAYYRLVLPREFQPDRYDHDGRWHARLEIGRREPEARPEVRAFTEAHRIVDRSSGGRPRREAEAAETVFSRRRLVDNLRTKAVLARSLPGVPEAVMLAQGQRALPFSIVVHTYSNLSFQASAQQSSYEVGSQIRLHATLAVSGIPTSQNSEVWAEVTRPDATNATVPLLPQEEGRFVAELPATAPGVYRCRIRAQGTTGRGERFTRERTVTASVWSGGDRDAVRDNAGRELIDHLRERDERLCELLDCLAGHSRLSRALEAGLDDAGIDLTELERCLRRYCRGGGQEEHASRDE